jgi:lipopolysaccharide export system protein LptC
MTYNKYTIFSFIMIAALGLATWTRFMSSHQQTNTIANRPLLPDAYMEDVVAIIMDKQGKPSMKIVTPNMVHYTENDTTQLKSPQLTLYRKSPKPWFITAKYAKATQGIDNVDFWDTVTLHHAADENNPATLIKTITLTVHPNKQIAQTKDLITLIQPNLVVKATGMYADMNTGDIKLLSQARGEYVPSS